MDRTNWVFAVAAFVLGAGIGLFAGAGTGLFRAPEESLVPAEPGPGSAAAPSAGEFVPGEPGKGSGGAEGDPGAPAPGASPLARAIAGVPSPEAAAGTGAITGFVRKGDGAPLAGALVRATRAAPDAGSSAWTNSGAPPREGDLETEAREWIARRKAEQAGRRESLSGPDGAYSIQGLPDEPFALSAFKEGFRIFAPGRRFPVRPGATVDFSASALFEVPVDVLLPDGSRPRAARISVRQGPARAAGRPGRFDASLGLDPRGAEWTPERSILWLSPGVYTLIAESAQAGREGELRSDPKEITVAEGAAAPSASLALKEAAGIRGRVAVPAGLDVEAVQVRVFSLAPGETPDPKKLSQGMTRPAASASANRAEGFAFSFRGLEPGTYLVATSFGWRKITASATVTVADRMAEADLALPPLEPRETVLVRGYGPAGELLRDLQVYAQCRTADGGIRGSGHPISQKDGNYRLLLEMPGPGEGDPAPAREGRFVVSASSGKYGRKEAEFVPGRDAEVEVRFLEPAFLEATIAGYGGSGLEGKVALVLSGTPGEEGFPWIHGDAGGQRPNAAGVQTLGPVQPGSYEVSFRYFAAGDDVPFETASLGKTPVSLGPGTTRLTLGLPPLHSLTVWVEKGGEGGTVWIQFEDGQGHWRKALGKDGRATFDWLPAGAYVVHVSGGSAPGGRMHVDVSGTAVVRFEPDVVRAFRVSVNDPKGALATAGFRTGDLIVGVEGMEFKNETHMQAVVFGALSKKEVKILVLRDGQKVEIAADLNRLLGDKADPGGSFEPSTR
ncbi:MAG: hypothetical protein MUC63_08765 [Planctomycetes bacterium]|nr:hypothetical protein [Planctomycetota bacterium]